MGTTGPSAGRGCGRGGPLRPPASGGAPGAARDIRQSPRRRLGAPWSDDLCPGVKRVSSRRMVTVSGRTRAVPSGLHPIDRSPGRCRHEHACLSVGVRGRHEELASRMPSGPRVRPSPGRCALPCVTSNATCPPLPLPVAFSWCAVTRGYPTRPLAWTAQTISPRGEGHRHRDAGRRSPPHLLSRVHGSPWPHDSCAGHVGGR